MSEHHAQERARVGADDKLRQTLAPTLKRFEVVEEGGWTGIFAYMVIEKPIFAHVVFGNMVFFRFMVNFVPVPRWTIYPGASVTLKSRSPSR